MRFRTLLYCGQSGGANDKHKCPWNGSHSIDHPDRICECRDLLIKEGLLARCQLLRGRPGTTCEVSLCHPLSYLNTLASTNTMSQWALEILSAKYDRVFLCPGSYEAAMWAVGSAVEAMEKLLSQNDHQPRCDHSLVLVRPAGHSAGRDQPSNYCLLNNVAICAQVAVQKHRLQRVTVLDWGTSGGSTTEALLQHDRRFVCLSIVKSINGSHWPWQQPSNNANSVTVPVNTDELLDSDYLSIFRHVICPVLRESRPELVLISAGFQDPLAFPSLSSGVYAHVIRTLQLAIPKVPLCVVLENGPARSLLGPSVKWTLKSLLGDCLPSIGPLNRLTPSVAKSIWMTVQRARSTWQSLADQMDLFNHCRSQMSLDRFQWGRMSGKDNVFRCKMDNLLEKGLYPTRRLSISMDGNSQVSKDGPIPTGGKLPLSVCFPEGCESMLLTRRQFGPDQVMFLLQNRCVSNRELDLVHRQTQATCNHEHDMDESFQLVDAYNEICRLMGGFVSSLDTISADLVESSICLVDIPSDHLHRTVRSAVPILRKMGKFSSNQRVLLVDLVGNERSDSDENSDWFLASVYMGQAFRNSHFSEADREFIIENFFMPIAYEFCPQIVVISILASHCHHLVGFFASLSGSKAVLLINQDSAGMDMLHCVSSFFSSNSRPFSPLNPSTVVTMGKMWAEEFSPKWTLLKDTVFDKESAEKARIAETASYTLYSHFWKDFFDSVEGQKSLSKMHNNNNNNNNDDGDNNTVKMTGVVSRFLHKLLFCVPSNTTLSLN